MTSYLNNFILELFSSPCNQVIPAESARTNKHIKTHTDKGEN